jgi:putative membrane protein
LKNYLKIYIKGMCMGVADVIPGISGGTLALMLGIYERLISGIKSVSPKLILELFKNLQIWKGECRSEILRILKELDAFFLLTLGAGVFTAVLAVSSIIPFLIYEHTEYTFACFLGLIAPSIYIPWKLIKTKSTQQYIAIILGLTLTVASSMIMKDQVGDTIIQHNFQTMAIILFASAIIAISAMILPGISGSFILMLLGQYIVVTGLIARFKVDIFKRAVNDRKLAALKQVEHFSTIESLLLLGIFICGCVIGILIMSRVIHFALQKAHDTTMAFLTGMICSSFYVLWPFKEKALEGIEKALWLKKAANILPDINGNLAITSVIFLVATAVSTSLIVYSNKTSKA